MRGSAGKSQECIQPACSEPPGEHKTMPYCNRGAGTAGWEPLLFFSVRVLTLLRGHLDSKIWWLFDVLYHRCRPDEPTWRFLN